MLIERNFSLDEQIEENPDSVIVAIDLKAIAGIIDFGASIPSESRKLAGRVEGCIGIGENDIRELEVVTDLEALKTRLEGTYKFIHPSN